MQSKTQPIMSVIRANFQFKFNRNVEITYARALEKRCFCVYFPSPPTVPSTKPPKLRKNGLQRPIEDDVILHEMNPFFVQILIRV